MIPKFRAWDKVLKKMTYSIIISKDWALAEVPIDIFNMFGNLEKRYKFMQSTELKDKNDNEIFEGDVIKPLGFASWIGVVGYASDKAAYILKDHDNDFLRDEPVYLSQFCEGLEVLGNIYENPELLEKR